MPESQTITIPVALAPICAVICHCGPEGEPLACGYAPNHDGTHSWASIPSFCYGEHKWKRQRQGGAPDDIGSLEVVEFCDNCGMEKPDGD